MFIPLLNMNFIRPIFYIGAVGFITCLPILYILNQISFDGLYGQDPYAYYEFSEQLIEFFKSGDFPGPFFWPWGYPGLLAFGKALNLPGIAVNIILFGFIPSILFLISKELNLSAFAAGVASISIAISGQMTQSSLLMMSDIGGVFWCLVSLLFMLKYQNKRLLRNLILSGVFLAFAAITRWIYLGMAIPWALYLLSQKTPIKDMLKSLICPEIIIIFQINLGKNDEFSAFEHHFFDHWSLSNFYSDSLKGAEGITSVITSNLSFYTSPVTEQFWLSPIFIPFLILGCFYLLFSKQLSKLSLLLPWILIPYLFFCGLPVQNDRYSLILFPAICLIIGEGVDFIYRNISPRRLIEFLIVGVAAGGIYSNISSNTPLILSFLQSLNKDKETAAWVSQNVDKTGSIYAFGITLTLQHYYPEFKTMELYFESPDSLAVKLKTDKPNYLIANTATIEGQWAKTSLAESFFWLKDVQGATLIGTHNNYSLFQIHD